DKARDRLKDFDPSTRELLERLLPLVVSLSERKLDRIPPGELSALVRRLARFVLTSRPRPGMETQQACCYRMGLRLARYFHMLADKDFNPAAGRFPFDSDLLLLCF